MPSGSNGQRTIRWWPAGVIAGVAGAAIIAIRFWPSWSFQEKNLRTAGAIALTFLLLMLWALAFSRLRWQTRLLVCGLSVLCIGGLAASLRIRGVSGDLLPLLEWRFARRTGPPPVATVPPSAPTSTPVSPAFSSALSSTNDYPQYLGPDRTGRVEGPALALDWEARPPEQRWRRPVGPAWSGFAVRGPFAVTMEQSDGLELVTCYDLSSGNLLWSHSDTARYQTTIAGEGPRTTPTIHADRVFSMGATGLLNCLELATGRRVWMKDVPKENEGSVGEWGASCSPLVIDGLVMVTTGAGGGRSLVAYDIQTGERRWTAGDERASYSSPVRLSLLGTEQILSFNAARVTAHDPSSGKVLWEHPWPAGHPHITPPLLLAQDRVLVSSGYGVGSELLQIRRGSDGAWGVRRLWKSNRLKSKFANLIQHEAHIYGLDDGVLVCLEAASGRLAWKEGRYGHGQIIATRDVLLIMAESGDVVLVQASPDAPRELARFRALSGKTWNPPALAGRTLLVRNDLEAACYTLPLAER